MGSGYTGTMRKIAAWVGVLALFTGAVAITNPNLKPSFADLTWYSNRQVVKQQMLKKGYIFKREVADGSAVDVEFTGKIQGIPAKVLHYFNSSNQLVKTQIVFEKSYSSSMYKNWQDIKTSLDGKYGLSLDLSTLNKYASTDHDVLLESNLNRGEKVAAAWVFPKYNYTILLSLEQAYVNNQSYYLSLAYESPAWGKELDRRRGEGDL